MKLSSAESTNPKELVNHSDPESTASTRFLNEVMQARNSHTLTNASKDASNSGENSGKFIDKLKGMLDGFHIDEKDQCGF